MALSSRKVESCTPLTEFASQFVAGFLHELVAVTACKMDWPVKWTYPLFVSKAARKALAEMKRKGHKAIPLAEVKKRLGMK